MQMHTVSTHDTSTIFHKPTAKISCFQKNTYYAVTKSFNNLPSDLKILMNENARFKIARKRYLTTHSSYSTDEYLLSQKWLIHLQVA
jgi:hypothetical protein